MPLPEPEQVVLQAVWALLIDAQGTGRHMLKSDAKRYARQALLGGRSPLGLCFLAICASCVPAGNATRPQVAAAGAAPSPAGLAQAPVPQPEPLLLQPIAPDTAMAMNAAIPVSDGFNPPARPFSFGTRTATDRMRSIECLTATIYYEAASESEDGQRAVAQVVLNRVRHPAYPASVCGVVYQGSERSSGCQFTFTCDGSLLRTPSVAGWVRARRIAAAALSGSVYAPVGHATHYHTHQVLPHWAPSLIKSAVIGAHIFYRWNGGWGTPAAFRQAYVGVEPLRVPKPPQLVTLPVLNETAIQAQIAAVLAAGPPAAAPPIIKAAAAEAAPDEVLPQPSVSKLPESQVLEAWRYSGMPRDQVPADAK